MLEGQPPEQPFTGPACLTGLAVLLSGVTHILCSLLQGSKKEGRLALARQLIGNNDEVTDLRLLGPPEAPTHLALATNSPAIRVFDIQTLNCTATLAGHTDTVLVMDALLQKVHFSPHFITTSKRRV